MSVYNLFLQTNQNMHRYLIKELLDLGIKCKHKPSLNEIQITCDFENIFKILHQVKTVERVKIQIGAEILARDEKEIAKNLAKLPFHAYLPINIYDYQFPKIKCHSFQSKMYHEKMITEILDKHIRLIPVRKEYLEMRKLGVQESYGKPKLIEKKMQQKQKLIGEIKEKIKDQRLLLENYKQDQQNQSPYSQQSSSEKQSEIELHKLQQELQLYEQLPEIPDIWINLQRNKMRVTMNLHQDSLHKHGFKEQVNSMPIKESIVAAGFSREKLFQKKKLKLWDPFCGSGTLLIELIYLIFNLPIRTGKSNNYFPYFKEWKIFPQDEYSDYLKNLQKYKNTNIQELFEEISILGSDINAQSLAYSAQNFERSHEVQELLNNQKQIQNNQQNLTRILPHIQQYTFFQNQINFLAADFESVYNSYLNKNLEGYTIVANLPYNERSKSQIGFKELQNTFIRFSKLLKKNINKIEGCYIFTTIKNGSYNKSHFLSVSGLNWELVGEFESGPLKIGLFKLIQNEVFLKQKLQEAETYIEQVNEQQQQIQLNELQSPEKIVYGDDKQRYNQNKQQQIVEVIETAVGNHILQPRDMDVYRHKMPREEYERQQYEIKQENIKKMKEDFIEKFKDTKHIKETALQNLPKNLQRTSGRSIVHKKRLEMVRREKLNDMLSNIKEIHNKKQELITEASAKRKLRVAQQMLRSVDIDEDQAYEIQEKIKQQTIEKKKEIKNRKQKKSSIPKIPKW